MPGAYLYGFRSDTGAKVKIVCNAAGQLIIDPTELFENPPTEDEAKKGPSSDWAFDHKANVAAHHAKFTAAEARTAINDIFDSTGRAIKNINFNRKQFRNLDRLYMIDDIGGNDDCIFYFRQADGTLYIHHLIDGGAASVTYIKLFSGTEYEIVAVRPWVDAKYGGLVGTLYWSCAGVHFDPLEPDVDDITKFVTGPIRPNTDGISFVANVSLPDGATVTGVRVYGNTAAAAETWTLTRLNLSTSSRSDMATNNINAEDTSITDATVDNSLYAYYLFTTSLDTNDEIYGARITYTL